MKLPRYDIDCSGYCLADLLSVIGNGEGGVCKSEDVDKLEAALAEAERVSAARLDTIRGMQRTAKEVSEFTNAELKRLHDECEAWRANAKLDGRSTLWA